MSRFVSLTIAMLLAGCSSQPAPDVPPTANTATASAEAAASQAAPPAAAQGGNAEAPRPAKEIASSSVPRDCYLKVDGVVHVDGTCLVFPMGDHAYTMNTWTKGKPAQSHFAMVSADPDGTGTATWNADPDDDRALDPLGTVRRDGDCWINDRARLCVR